VSSDAHRSIGRRERDPPGPRSRELSALLARVEAPGVNTLYRGEPSIVWAEAEGCHVVDVDGHRYVDLTSGFGAAAVGHRHPRVVAAVREQSSKLLHALGDVAAHPARIELARRLVALSPVDDAKVYPAVSGADAVEIAVKTALLSTGRGRVLAFDPGYHGLTFGALAVTSRPAFRQPFEKYLAPVERLPFGAPVAEIERSLARGDVAAVVVEPIVGREGVLLPPAGWLAGVAERARAAGTLLVADEIFTGFGRTGRRFAVDGQKGEAVRPDLLCVGKALGGGLPLGAVIGRGELMDAWATPGEALHTATFVGHPLAMAAALAVLDLMDEESLPARARRLGENLVAPRLELWPERFPAVTETRGRGLLWGVVLDSDRVAGQLVGALARRGVLALAGGPEGRVLQITPPLTVPEELLEQALDLIERSLATIPR
jgi:4-aminobutyrate aminotransferase-like enzyme